MKLKELGVGEQYVFNGYGYRRKCAEVIEKGVELQWLSYKGVRIKIVESGEIKDVPARELGPTWAKYEEEMAERMRLDAERHREELQFTRYLLPLGLALNAKDIEADVTCNNYPPFSVNLRFTETEDLDKMLELLGGELFKSDRV